MDDARARQVAQNESLFREVNERIQDVSAHWEAAAGNFLCECGNEGCTEMLSVPLESYEATRANPRRFLITPGHEQLEFERLVETRADYAVVEKLGAGAEEAEHLDPRRRDSSDEPAEPSDDA